MLLACENRVFAKCKHFFPLVSIAASCLTFWHAGCVFDLRNMPFNCSSEATRVVKSMIGANTALIDTSDLLHITLSLFVPLERVP